MNLVLVHFGGRLSLFGRKTQSLLVANGANTL